MTIRNQHHRRQIKEVADKEHAHFSASLALNFRTRPSPRERQRRDVNTARGNAPGTDAIINEGLKARLNRNFLHDRQIESGLQPSTFPHHPPGALPRAVLSRAVGARERHNWTSGDSSSAFGIRCPSPPFVLHHSLLGGCSQPPPLTPPSA